MHPDKKVGLALGILLIGITGAFFFRNDAPSAAQETLTLTDPAALDRKASQKPGAPYFPEPMADDENGEPGSDLASVPEISASDAIPGLPRVGPTGYQGMLAEPINLDALQNSAEQFADRMTPLPSPGRDLDSLDNVLARNAEARRSEGTQSGGVKGDKVERSRHLTLFEANRDVLATPDDLSLGMKLKIPVKSSATNASSGRGPASSSTSTATATGSSSVAKSGKSQSFVQPDRSAVIALGGARRSGRSLSQAPPPNLPRVEGLNPGGDPPEIASQVRFDGT